MPADTTDPFDNTIALADALKRCERIEKQIASATGSLGFKFLTVIVRMGAFTALASHSEFRVTTVVDDMIEKHPFGRLSEAVEFYNAISVEDPAKED